MNTKPMCLGSSSRYVRLGQWTPDGDGVVHLGEEADVVPVDQFDLKHVINLDSGFLDRYSTSMNSLLWESETKTNVPLGADSRYERLG